VAAVLVLFVPCSCSLGVDWPSFTGGAIDGGGGDRTGDASLANADGAPSAVAEAGADGATDDACNPGDLCDDFEVVNVRPLGGTVGTFPVGGGTAAIDTVRPYRGAHSLHLAKTGDPTGRLEAKVAYVSSGSFSSCDFWYWVQQQPESAGAALLAIFDFGYVGTGSVDAPQYHLWTEISRTTGNLVEQLRSGTDRVSSFAAPAEQAWHHFRMDMQTASFAMRIDDGPQTVLALTLRPSSSSSLYTATFGINYEDDTGTTWEAFVDDVHCRP
jgi:hypothetical protein